MTEVRAGSDESLIRLGVAEARLVRRELEEAEEPGADSADPYRSFSALIRPAGARQQAVETTSGQLSAVEAE